MSLLFSDAAVKAYSPRRRRVRGEALARFSYSAFSASPQYKLGTPINGEQGGFTLIEVVLALTIFALMGTILYGAFSLSHSAVEKSEANSTRNQKQRAITELLGNYIRSAFPYKESPQDQSIYFTGEGDSVTFVSAYSQALGGRGMAKIYLGKEEDGAHRMVIKLEETAPVRIGGDELSFGSTHGVTFEADMREIRFAYLDPQSGDEKWEERWDGRERRALPRAVAIHFVNANGEQIRWVFPVMMIVLAH